MRRIFSFLLCVAIAVGCAPKPPPAPPQPVPLLPDTGPGEPVEVTLHVDTDCSAQEMMAMILAANSWRSQTSGLIRIDLKFDLSFGSLSGLLDHLREGHNLVICHPDGLDGVPPHVLAWVEPGDETGVGIKHPSGSPVRMNIMSDRVGSDIRESAILHEFGHIVGLDHVRKVGSVMYPASFPGSPTCLKAEDFKELCRVTECGTTKFYPCE